MYKISVPVMIETLENYGVDETLSYLKRIGAQRVFLCPSDSVRLWQNYDREIARLKKYVGVMHDAGFETGVWVWTFMYDKPSAFTYMTSPDGKESSSCVCPSDPAYREKMGGFIEDAAKTGIDLFMFDDDFRYGFIDIGFGCCCKNHIKLIEEDLGEKVTGDVLKEKLLSGDGGRYRNAFRKANGRALEEFALDMRRHIDRVNPGCRMGFCSCITSWDIDGAAPDKIAKCLAGNTKPFYRLIGAPYWAAMGAWGNRLGDVIEFERLEESRRKDPGIEIFSEGDTYPRPRFKTPAAYLEGFDTALRAAGCMDGILKYALDYTSPASYDEGYVLAHEKNKKLYGEIESVFGNKTSCGIKVWDYPEKYDEIPVPDTIAGTSDVQNSAFPAGARMLVSCSLPAVYEGEYSAGIAFGEDVRAVPDDMLGSGLIIDMRAAEILKEKGIDTGLVAAEGVFKTGKELFGDNLYVSLGFPCEVRKAVLSPCAEVESYFCAEDKKYPASYRYENAAGMRFLVFCFDAYFNGEGLRRQYARASQIINAVPYLSGKKIPAVCEGHPDLYIMTKTDGCVLAAGLWNFCPDGIDSPIVETGVKPLSVRGINCKAEITGGKIALSRLEPYAFAGIEVTVDKKEN